MERVLIEIRHRCAFASLDKGYMKFEFHSMVPFDFMKFL